MVGAASNLASGASYQPHGSLVLQQAKSNVMLERVSKFEPLVEGFRSLIKGEMQVREVGEANKLLLAGNG